VVTSAFHAAQEAALSLTISKKSSNRFHSPAGCATVIPSPFRVCGRVAAFRNSATFRIAMYSGSCAARSPAPRADPEFERRKGIDFNAIARRLRAESIRMRAA
jgi:hypothetical protein